jgi:hypothetical protein
MNDLLFTQGQDNLAGLIGELYLVPAEDVTTIPALTAANSGVTAGDIVLAAGKKFSRVYFTDETGKVEVKPVGERDGKGFETLITARYPKLGTALYDFLRQVRNTPVVIIFKMANDGKKYLMGISQFDIASTALSKDIPAYFETGDATSGEKRPDQNGALLGWKFTSNHGPIEYGGAIDLTA